MAKKSIAKKEMTRAEKAKYTSSVRKVQAALKKWLDSGIELFLLLRDIELAGHWKAPGHVTFTDFLQDEFPNAIGIERYTNVVRAIELHGPDFVRKIGVHACHTVTVKAIADDPGRTSLLRASIEEHIESTGVSPDHNKIRDIVRGIAPETGRPSRETIVVLLKAEIKRLKKQIRELEEENAELRSASGGNSRRPAKKPKKGPLANRHARS